MSSDNRQRGERSGAEFVVQFRGALQQAGVEIEHVTRKRFAARWAPQQKGNLAISLRVLGKIVVEDHRVAFGITEIFAHSACSVRSDVLLRSWLRCRRRHHDRVFHRACVGQRLDDLRNRRALLPDRAIDADHVAALLVDDGVQNDGSFSGLAIADD
jgi:hypothetical protein